MDRRVGRSKRMIENSFFELLDQKPVNKITIKDICDAADINRTTFYRYYQDYPDFLRNMQDVAAGKILQAFDTYQFDAVTDTTVDMLFSNIRNNKNLFAFLFQSDLNQDVIRIIQQYVREKTREGWQKHSDLSDLQFDVMITYVLYGQFGVLKLWYDSSFMLDEEELKKIYINIMHHGIKEYAYKW